MCVLVYQLHDELHGGVIEQTHLGLCAHQHEERVGIQACLVLARLGLERYATVGNRLASTTLHVSGCVYVWVRVS